jgi:hypothetical protein
VCDSRGVQGLPSTLHCQHRITKQSRFQASDEEREHRRDAGTNERRWRLDKIFKLQAWERYNVIPDGDLLLPCLNDPRREPLAFVNTAKLSDLQVFRAEP